MLHRSSIAVPENCAPIFQQSVKGAEAVRSAWAHLVCLDVTPVGTRQPSLQAKTYSTGNISLGLFEGSAAHLERSRVLARGCADDLVMCAEGRTRTRASQGILAEQSFAPGDVHLWRSDCAMRCETEGDFSALLVVLPSMLLKDNGVDVERVLRSGRLASSSAEVRLFLSYARGIGNEMERLPPAALSQCFTHIKDLALMALGAGADARVIAGGRGVKAVRLKAIKADIGAHLTETVLSPSWIAGRHGISERYLRVLFAADDTSFRDYVLKQRLELAHGRLRDPGWQHRAIGDVAYASGFGDLSWFDRAFHRRFGMTPTEARRLLLSGLKS